jgi:hypothetical protein
LALAEGIAVGLALHPHDSSWSRRMNGAKGGKASAQSPRHFPIERARQIKQFKMRRRREQAEYQESLKINPRTPPPYPSATSSGLSLNHRSDRK